MKQVFIMVLPFIFMAACTQESESSEQMTLRAQKEKAIIAKGVQSLRVAFFYVPDPQSTAAAEATVSPASMATFAKKSKLYQNKELIQQPMQVVSNQYRAFVKANPSDPRLSQFRRETAEALLTENKLSISTTDKAYFTNELIATRSSNLALMCTSIQSLQGKIEAAEHSNMVRKAQILMNQYQEHYNTELAKNKDKPTSTYQQRAMKALDARFAELVLIQIRENQDLLAVD